MSLHETITRIVELADEDDALRPDGEWEAACGDALMEFVAGLRSEPSRGMDVVMIPRAWFEKVGQPAPIGPPVVDLMAALRASVEAAKSRREASVRGESL